MDVNVNEEGGVTVVSVDGELDTNSAPVAQQQILPLAQAGCKLVLDMTKVPYMSSAGIRVLLSTYRTVTSNGGKIVIVGLADDVRETMNVTGFLKFFQTFDTLEAGRQAIAQ
jgi:anti-sigma B factor antagonist